VILALILVQVCDEGYGKNVMKKGRGGGLPGFARSAGKLGDPPFTGFE
jgi:hypothetical protein